MSLIDLDITVFEYINRGMSNALFDWILPMWRNSYFWIPVYVFIVAFFITNFGAKAYWVVIFMILTLSTSDMVSSGVIKKSIKRLRPCNTENLMVIERVSCGSGYSFTSSHATNHFALSSFLVFTIGMYHKKVRPWLWLWAATVSFAQIYVGVHFPMDILAGSILGITIGAIWAFVFNTYYGYILEKEG